MTLSEIRDEAVRRAGKVTVIEALGEKGRKFVRNELFKGRLPHTPTYSNDDVTGYIFRYTPQLKGVSRAACRRMGIRILHWGGGCN